MVESLYLNVTQSEFDDLVAVFQERSQDFRYSIEDSEDGAGVLVKETHIGRLLSLL